MRLAGALSDLERLERAAAAKGPLQSLDPRAKLAVALVFLIVTASAPNDELLCLVPLFLYPAVLLAFVAAPLSLFLRLALYASPLVLTLGLFLPWVDDTPYARMGAWTITHGTVVFLSLTLRFLLTVSVGLLLAASAGIGPLLDAAARWGCPRVLLTQFMLLYRHVFIVSREAERMARAHALRAGTARTLRARVWVSLVGHLFLRAYDRSTRVCHALRCRGFNGPPPPSPNVKWRWFDFAYAAGWTAFFIAARWGDIPRRVGEWFLGADA
jgi:cobalt/nickel transport system permease protein